MSKRALIVVLSVCALAASGCGSSTEQADAKVARDFFGVAPQDAINDADIARMAAGKVGSFHLLLNWGGVETEPGIYDWSEYDSLLTSLAINDMVPITYVFGTPDHLGDGATTPPTDSPQSLAAWSEFLEAAAARYGPNGDFWEIFALTNPGVEPRPIEIWEIWNEQNGPTFWPPKPSPAAYARLLKTSAKAIKSVEPRAQIMIAGMFATPASPKAINSFKFLRKLYAKNGVAEASDLVGVHPYGPKLKDVQKQVAKTFKEMKRGGDRKAGLWVTEFGWGSDTGVKSQLTVSPKKQAKLLRQGFELFMSKRRKWNIEGALWYTWRDSNTPVGACNWCPSAGLVDPDLDAKPSWLAYTRLTGGDPTP